MKRAAIAAAVIALTVPASASAADSTTAERLFREGRALAAQGNYEAACPKLEESERIDPGMGTLYNVADCHERLGKTATAWNEFVQVQTAAHSAGQRARELAAKSRAETLAPKLAHIVVMGAAPPGAEVLRDGKPVSPKELGVGIAVDPGRHEVVVRKPDCVTWQSSFVTTEGQTSRVMLPTALAPLPSLTSAQVAQNTAQNMAQNTSTSASTAVVEPAPAVAAPPPITPDTTSSWGAQKIGGVALGAAGLVSLGVGAYFAMRSIDRRDSAQDHCSGNVCDAQGVSLRSDAMSSGDVATITLIAGGAATVAGTVLFLTAPAERSSAPPPPTGAKSLHAEPWVSFSSAGLSLRGAFE
jgi:serine/threonine-protein kinase